MDKRLCVVCGDEFVPRSARQKFCSDRCRFGVGTCEQCGRTFTKKSGTTGNFCSSDCWYRFNKEQHDKICPVCMQAFHPAYSQQVACSYECSDKYRARGKEHICKTCGSVFFDKASKKRKYCSRSCAMAGQHRAGQRGNHPDGAIIKHSDGYNMIKVNGKWTQEHRCIMSQALGRSLEDHERVHHKNGVRDDNRLENLELWSFNHKDPPGVRVRDLLILELQSSVEFQSLHDECKEIVVKILRGVK